jgi:hypothetical protein
MTMSSPFPQSHEGFTEFVPLAHVNLLPCDPRVFDERERSEEHAHLRTVEVRILQRGLIDAFVQGTGSTAPAGHYTKSTRSGARPTGSASGYAHSEAKYAYPMRHMDGLAVQAQSRLPSLAACLPGTHAELGATVSAVTNHAAYRPHIRMLSCRR